MCSEMYVFIVAMRWFYCDHIVLALQLLFCVKIIAAFFYYDTVVNHLVPWPPLSSLSFILLYIIVNGNTCIDRLTDQLTDQLIDQLTVSIPVT